MPRLASRHSNSLQVCVLATHVSFNWSRVEWNNGIYEPRRMTFHVRLNILALARQTRWTKTGWQCNTAASQRDFMCVSFVHLFSTMLLFVPLPCGILIASQAERKEKKRISPKSSACHVIATTTKTWKDYLPSYALVIKYSNDGSTNRDRKYFIHFVFCFSFFVFWLSHSLTAIQCTHTLMVGLFSAQCSTTDNRLFVFCLYFHHPTQLDWKKTCQRD